MTDDAPAAAPSAWRSGAERSGARLVWQHARGGWDAIHRALVRIDPNDDPDAEPLGLVPVAAVLVGVIASSWMFLRWKYQPMQDYFHYAAIASVISDWGRHGSIYTALYEKPELFGANSLVYVVSAYLGRLVGVGHAMRACLMLYVAGMPLITLYALRVFGRSPWPALVSVPLVFWNMSYIAGFVNWLVAAPLMLMALLALYRLFTKPAWWRLVAAMALFAATFLTHAHTYLWTGGLAFLLSVGFLFASARETTWRACGKRAAFVAGAALAAVLPSLLLFWLWYRKSFGAQGGGQGTMNHLGNATEGFGASFASPSGAFEWLLNQFRCFGDVALDARFLVWLGLLTFVAVACSRLHRFNKPPLLELACAITAISYFFLPESIKGQEVIAQRQPGMALWLLPAVLSPVPWRASRVARAVVVTGIIAQATMMLRTWHGELAKFEKEEAAGLEQVLAAAPPRARLHYVKTDPGSAYFAWRPFWHVEKAIMSDKLGQTPDTGGINATSAIHYRPGVDYHRITNHTPYWQDMDEIWKNFDVVLVRRWHPSPQQLERANKHGERIAQAGDWELWKSHEATPPVFQP